MPIVRAEISPLDPILFGDNRSARAGQDHAQTDQDPSPPTLYGAVGGRIASALGAHGQRHWGPAEPVLGPFVGELEDPAVTKRAALLGYTLRGTDGTLWFPKPLHLRIERHGNRDTLGGTVTPAPEADGVLSSLPFDRRLTCGDDTPDHRLHAEVEEPRPVSERLLRAVLAADSDTMPVETCPLEELYQPDRRLGLAMDNATNTAVPGRLFSRPYRRFVATVRKEGLTTAGYTAWYSVLSAGSSGCQDWAGVGFLGGDRRRASFRFENEDPPLASLRSAVAERAGASRGFLAYLLTPAVATGQQLEVAGRRPVAAAIGRPREISGWDASGASPGPRPVRTLVPAGSVYFFDWNDDEGSAERRAELVTRHWLAPLDPAYGAAGFGRVLVGIW